MKVEKTNNYMDLVSKEDYDFGFSFTDEKELMKVSVEYASLADQVVDLKKRLHAIKSIFLPLLENLNKEPDKTFIKWPNRKDIIEKQIKNLHNITNV